MVESSGSSPVSQLREYTGVLKINGKHFLLFKLDPGSQVNLIPYHIFMAVGSFEALAETKYGASMVLRFDVAKQGKRPILGIQACHDLNLVRLVAHPEVDSLLTKPC